VRALQSPKAARATEPCNELPPLFDHLVGAQQDRWGYLKAEGFRGFDVQGHLKFDRQLNWKLRRLCTMKDAIDVIGGPTIQIRVIRPIG
jgi:hypothetical protein